MGHRGLHELLDYWRTRQHAASRLTVTLGACAVESFCGHRHPLRRQIWQEFDELRQYSSLFVLRGSANSLEISTAQAPSRHFSQVLLCFCQSIKWPYPSAVCVCACACTAPTQTIIAAPAPSAVNQRSVFSAAPVLINPITLTHAPISSIGYGCCRCVWRTPSSLGSLIYSLFMPRSIQVSSRKASPFCARFEDISTMRSTIRSQVFHLITSFPGIHSVLSYHVLKLLDIQT